MFHRSTPPLFIFIEMPVPLFCCSFFIGLCVVCYSSIYGFWLPVWYVQTLLASQESVCWCIYGEKATMKSQYRHHLCVAGIDFASFCQFEIWFRNYSNSVVGLFVYFCLCFIHSMIINLESALYKDMTVCGSDGIIARFIFTHEILVSVDFCLAFCRLFCVFFCSVSFWPLYYLSIVDLRPLITPVVSSFLWQFVLALLFWLLCNLFYFWNPYFTFYLYTVSIPPDPGWPFEPGVPGCPGEPVKMFKLIVLLSGKVL